MDINVKRLKLNNGIRVIIVPLKTKLTYISANYLLGNYQEKKCGLKKGSYPPRYDITIFYVFEFKIFKKKTATATNDNIFFVKNILWSCLSINELLQGFNTVYS